LIPCVAVTAANYRIIWGDFTSAATMAATHRIHGVGLRGYFRALDFAM